MDGLISQNCWLKLLELTWFYNQIYKFTVIYFNSVWCWGPLWSKEIFRAQSIYGGVYEYMYAYIKLIIFWLDGSL